VNTDKTILSEAVTLVIRGSIFIVIERVIARGRNRTQPIIRKGWLTDIDYKHLDESTQDNILAILVETKSGLPEEWKHVQAIRN
jgi:hypothetical protein